MTSTESTRVTQSGVTDSKIVFEPENCQSKQAEEKLLNQAAAHSSSHLNQVESTENDEQEVMITMSNQDDQITSTDAIKGTNRKVLENVHESGSLESVDLGVGSPVPPYAAILARTMSEEAPDPRIQEELERLNTSTDTINKLEVELDEARLMFRHLLSDSTQRIDVLSRKLGKCVQQSRPYYDARIRAKQALQTTQAACLQYEKAVGEHNAAREMVYLAEEGLMQSGCTFDHTWQEMLNHASAKVNSAECAKHECGAAHLQASVEYQRSEVRVVQLQQQLKRAIARSSLNTRRSLLQLSNVVRMQELHLLPYFEAKSQVNQQLEWQKQRVKRLERDVGQAKGTYSQALNTLEAISDQIHKRRQSQLELGVRGVGVGAESPSGQQLRDEPLTPPNTSMSSATTTTTHDNASLPPTTTLDTASITLPHILTPTTLSTPPSVLPAIDVVVSSHASPAQSADGSDHQSWSGDLSSWQVVAADGSAAIDNTTAILLATDGTATIDDATTVSDNESLASMEMLSDDAIAGLMLEGGADLSDSNITPYTSPRPSLSAGTELANQRDLHKSPDASTQLASFNAVSHDAIGNGNDFVQQSGDCKNVASNNPFAITNPFYSSMSAETEDLMLEIDSVNLSTDTEVEVNISDKVSNDNSENVSEVSDSSHERSVSVIRVTTSTNNPKPSTPPINIDAFTSSISNLSLTDEHNKSSSSTSPVFLSPARSPVNRPCSLPLSKSNNSAFGVSLQQKTRTFIPEHNNAALSINRRYAETVVVKIAGDEGDDDVAGVEMGNTTASSSRSNSEDMSNSVSRSGTWSPELTTPAYAPLQDAMESPLTYPPPDYPPPPPPRHVRISNSPSPE